MRAVFGIHVNTTGYRSGRGKQKRLEEGSQDAALRDALLESEFVCILNV